VLNQLAEGVDAAENAVKEETKGEGDKPYIEEKKVQEESKNEG